MIRRTFGISSKKLNRTSRLSDVLVSFTLVIFNSFGALKDILTLSSCLFSILTDIGVERLFIPMEPLIDLSLREAILEPEARELFASQE